MFNKEKFSLIIRNIKNIYDSQEEFSKNSNIGRTSLSQYMNCRLNKPPKPDILKKLATASKGITTYDELMEICGYINLNGLYDINLNDAEITILNQMLLDYKDFSSQKHNTFNRFNEQKYLKNLSDESKNKILIAFRRNSLDLILNNPSTDIINEDEFRFVSEDDAMYPLLDIGDIALIHKQDFIEDGATLLISMNNSNTIRKFILNEDKSSYNLVAMNACYKKMTININEINKIKILGKVIKTENRSAFK